MVVGKKARPGVRGEPWQKYLDEVFPTYLMPTAMRQSIDAASAERFLTRLGGLPGHFELLRGASLLAGREEELHRFCLESLPALARTLPSRTVVERHVCNGGFHGQLALTATMKYLLEGAPNRFVTRTRMRTFDIAENQLLHSVAVRLIELIAGLRKAELLKEGHWGGTALACESELRRTLAKTPLSKIRSNHKITMHHERAARNARGAGYEDALAWHEWLNHALDEDDGPRLAEILARGALWPLTEHAQFEIAVLVRLIQGLDNHACRLSSAARSGIWDMQRSLVMAGRSDVARFVRDDGACIKVFYNQCILPGGERLGPRDRGVKHFFGSTGRIRPDITLSVEPAGQTARAMIVEIKHSATPKTWRQGYQEALAYRHEYAGQLLDWPKSVLVTSGDIPGTVSRNFEVVATDWGRWVPDVIVNAVFDALPR